MKQLLVFFLFLLYGLTTKAQIDSVNYLKETTVTEYRIQNINYSAHTDSLKLNSPSQILNTSLSTLLSTQSGVFVKDNGGGRLATLSVRGTSSSQNNVCWNGIALNTPSLGLYDLSLMPVFFADEVTVQYGGNGSLNGSDAIGGIVNIYSHPEFNKGFKSELKLNAGSFNDYEEGFKVRYSNAKLSMKSAFYRRDAENNYPISYKEKPTFNQTDARYFQSGIKQEFTFLHRKNIFSMHFMNLVSRHEIPALASSALKESEQVQNDNQIRITARWKHENVNSGIIVNAGYLHDIIHYIDGKTVIDDFSIGESIQLNAEYYYHFVKGALLLGGNAKLSSASVNSRTQLYTMGYPEKHQDEQMGIYASYIYRTKKLFTQVSLRLDPSMKEMIPLIPSIGISYQLPMHFFVKMNAAGIYRNPTLNDLFWTPGGNRNLIPEHGGQGDFFLGYKNEDSNIKSTLQAGVYYLNITDYIQWLPGADNIYSPVNQNKIVNRGMELSAEEKYTYRNWKFLLSGNLHYTLATKVNSEEHVSLAGNIGEHQLIYIPKTQWKINAIVEFKNTALQITNGYTGYRYTTEDNAYWLNPISVTEIAASQVLYISKTGITVSAGVSNLENKNYEIIAGRPVAGRAYRIGVTFRFN